MRIGFPGEAPWAHLSFAESSPRTSISPAQENDRAGDAAVTSRSRERRDQGRRADGVRRSMPERGLVWS
jgi:hypothetical protein